MLLHFGRNGANGGRLSLLIAVKFDEIRVSFKVYIDFALLHEKLVGGPKFVVDIDAG